MLVFLLILGRPILGWLLGEDFTAAFPTLCVLAGAQLINAMAGNVDVVLIAAKQERKLILGNVVALAVTLLAAWLFIPQYGALAAAVASGIGLSLRKLLALWFCYQSLGIISLPFAPLSGRRMIMQGSQQP